MPSSEDSHRQTLIKELTNPSFQSSTIDGQNIVNWVTHVLSLFIAFVGSLASNFENRINDLETNDENPPSTDPKNPATTQKQGKRPRCSKCHARGHVESDCRTIDPSSTRRRVAQNSRRKKAAAYPPPSFFYRPHDPRLAHDTTHTAYAAPVEYAALAADATELRRRSQQSARDKRRARRAPPDKTPSKPEKKIFVA